MTLEAVPIEYTRCAYCRNAAKKRVAYKGATRLVCDNHLKLIAKELNENIKLVVVKYDEPILKLPPIVSRNPEMEGMNCWNARDPEVQRKVEGKRKQESNLNTNKLNESLDVITSSVNIIAEMEGVSEIIVRDGIEYSIIAEYACQKDEFGVYYPCYTFKERKWGYIKPNELDIDWGL